MTNLVIAGAEVTAEANRLWNLGIYDPPRKRAGENPDRPRCRAFINETIKTSLGLGWKWQKDYLGDGDFEWCGAFAARCWAKYLPLSTRYTFFASTIRLLTWAQYHDWEDVANHPPTSGVRRLCVALNEHSNRLPFGVIPQGGDILLVGGVGSGPGKHVTIVEKFDGEFFYTIEGNGLGLPPPNWNGGHAWQGVVKGKRRLGLTPDMSPSTYHGRWLIRPAPSDLVLIG